MKQKIKILLIVIAIAIAIIIMLPINITGLITLNENQEYIKIGYVSSLSGDAGAWGQSLKNGFDFAIEEINSKGGINGKLIKPIYEDDGCEPKTGINAFKKVITMDNVKIITGTVCSSVALSVAPTTQENKVLYLASGATHPDVVKQGDLIFRIWVSDTYETEIITKYAINELNVNSLGVIYANDTPTGIAIKDTIEQILNENNKTIIKEEYNSGIKDFKSIITKMISKNPDAIYVNGVPENLLEIINELKIYGYKGKILAYGPALFTEGLIEKINDKSNVYYPLPITIEQTDFWENYKEKTGEDADILVSGGYDSMKLIEAGLNQCGEDNECIKNYWLSLKEYPITKGDIFFDESGDIKGIEYEIKELN